MFLPWLRSNRPGVRPIWFDPFGTTGIENICSTDEFYAREHNYILFFDQEPIDIERHRQTFQHLQNNVVVHKSPEPPLIITSELNSQAVDSVCKEFGIEQRYYFFHGWAALDWFRGYNQSYLMTPVHDRRITHTFLAPMRIIGGQRQHRVIMMAYILNFGLHHNYISFPNRCPAENRTIGQIVSDVTAVYPELSSAFNGHRASSVFPMCFSNESDHPMRSYQLDLFEESARSLLYLVTETVADGQRLHLTEKIFKPICLGMPFILVSTVGSLEYLRSYGFKTFGDFWDESYDQEPVMIKRIEKITQQLHQLDRMPQQKKQQLFDAMIPTIEHNLQHFYSGGFEKVLSAELNSMLLSL